MTHHISRNTLACHTRSTDKRRVATLGMGIMVGSFVIGPVCSAAAQVCLGGFSGACGKNAISTLDTVSHITCQPMPATRCIQALSRYDRYLDRLRAISGGVQGASDGLPGAACRTFLRPAAQSNLRFCPVNARQQAHRSSAG